MCEVQEEKRSLWVRYRKRVDHYRWGTGRKQISTGEVQEESGPLRVRYRKKTDLYG